MVEELQRLHANEAYEIPAPDGDAGSLHDPAGIIALQSILALDGLDQSQCGARETILLVEDETFVRKATAEVLESAGYRVFLACNAAEALDRQSHGFESIDLLLADVVMPGLSGHELAVRFLALNPLVRILMISGYSEQLAFCEVAPHRREYLAKPFSVPTLLRRVREVLDQTSVDWSASA